MLDHLDDVDKLVREMRDAADLLPDDLPGAKTDVHIMLNGILDRVLAIRINLLKLQTATRHHMTPPKEIK